MPGFKHHIFICENQREPDHPKGCCMGRGAKGLREAFKDEIERHGLRGIVRANRAGCLDTCEFGPSVVVYPEGVWYWVGGPEDVKEIVEKHIVGGEVVERLLMPDGAASFQPDRSVQEILENLSKGQPRIEAPES
ncbi:MAG: ferredoxin [Nitrospinota bacterium]